jgi:hypothetical protein
MRNRILLEDLHQALSDTLRPASIRIRQQHGELFTADTRGEVSGTTRHRLNHLSDATKALITFLVSIVVVVPFKIVDIDERKRQRDACSLSTQPLAHRHFIELPTVGNLRESIGCRLTAK